MTAAALILGILLGVAYLVWIEPVEERGRSVADFLVALRPLVLPLIVVGIAGTANFDPWVAALVVPILLIGGWYLIAAPEIRPDPGKTPAWEEIKRAARWLLSHRILLAVFAALALLLFVVSLRELVPKLDVNDDRPDALSSVMVIALIFWVTAVWFRLLGYFTSWLRVSVTVLSIAVFLRLLMTAGLIPGHDGLVDAAKGSDLVDFVQDLGHLALALAAALLAAIAADVVASLGRWTWLRDKGPLGRQATDSLRGVGFGLAVLATFALGLAAAVAVIDYESGSREGITPQDEVVAGQDVTRKRLPGDPHQLAIDYMPVLAFTDDERWAPVDVETYIHNTTCPAELVSTTEGGAVPVRKQGDEGEVEGCGGRHEDPDSADGVPIGALPTDCPSLRVPCYQITIRCPEGSRDCAEGHFREDRGEAVPDYRDGAVYVRTVPVGPVSSPPMIANLGPFDDLTTLVQYWYFYRYDEWTRPVLSGHIVQRHEGDWEAVTIGFSPYAPLFVGYSAHCGGSWQRWGNVEIAQTDEVKSAEGGETEKVEQPQPLIAVAEGSHANYVRTDDRRSSDWASCSGKAPKGTTTLLSYASNLRDETGHEWDWEPPREGVKFVDETMFPMTFPGSWGGSDVLELINERKRRLGGEGHGPLTPPLQQLWFNPLKAMFCGKDWDAPSGYGANKDCQRRGG